MSNFILYTVENEIATITLNRPTFLNALNNELVDEFLEILTKIKNSSTIRVVILTGNGRAFCAGGDLNYISTLTDIKGSKDFIEKVGCLVKQIMELNKPVIAMVNGVAAGAGFNLALAADIIFCGQSARFAQSFAKVGLVPDCGGMYLLPRIVGLHKAKELMFTADLIDAPKAYELGLINRVVEDCKLTEETLGFAEKLKSSAPIALSLIKETLNEYDTLDLHTLLTKESALQSICMQTLDHIEGIAAFKEKRSPKFQGQ